jgi:oligopeptide/dipeptide ABC transporter ATP-binding protein
MNPLLEVDDLKKYFRIGAAELKAVDGVSLAIRKGETLGLVGESGCGKSTLGRLLLRLVEPTSGTVRFDGTDLLDLPPSDLRRMRKRFQMVFQDPQSSLNPRMSVRRILEEPLRTHGMRGAERDARVRELVDAVGLPSDTLRRYAHEFSGGQRQRIGMARALALRPDFIVADEPVAALDVSIQAQVLNLMLDLKRAYGLTYLFISHDLSVVEYVSDRVGVMYLGRLVELADAPALYREPLHPYTQSLLSAIPRPLPVPRRDRITLSGDVPDPARPPRGCRFHTRCPFAEERCRVEDPAFRELRSGHFAACHFADRLPAK